ncbi:protein kinase [Streptomyces sp. So13.3]|uniref:protein kinase domain-containing protein n=1 Tax=Streptomyces TaxID=1883 RepID=UPI00164D8382|nr:MULTISPECIES: protein kinase [Streptomyces]MCZ4099354.1 protein kinase [Streptomyces sp. H39-C1]QNA70838.1 protein kinase [Streptomyces sp. So13.3]
MRWIGKRRNGTPESGDPAAEVLARLREGSASAEQDGREGRPGKAVKRYRELVVRATAAPGPDDPATLAMRHQLAHWTGESGDAEGAVRLFAQLLSDRERLQGSRHQDTGLARHQLAHWHGRAGRADEAVRRYEELQRSAEQEGRTEAALNLLCDMGHWQQQAGDNAAALRTYTRMLKTAENELGGRHALTGIARQRYAELAGGLPFGHERGHDSLQDLVAAAAEVERSGDLSRASRMYGQIADKCAQLYGAGSDRRLGALVSQAKAAMRTEDLDEAVVCFGRVLACMELRGEGPGSPEYDVLSEQRDGLARSTRETTLHIGDTAGTLLARQVEAAPATAFGLLARENRARHLTRVFPVSDGTDDPQPHKVSIEQWLGVIQRLADQGCEARSFYFARADRRPTPEEIALCARLGLLGVYVSNEGAGNVNVEAYSFRGGTPQVVSIVVVDEEQAAPEPAPARGPGGATAVHAEAEALGEWRQVGRATSARTAEDPAAFGSYEVLERVGEGGFGRVYLCQDPDGVMVAVKTLHAEYAADSSIREGFTHEVQAARRVSGRFTVPVIAADTSGGTPWMAVPFVAAPSLQEVAERCGALDAATVRGIGAGIATALTAIHAEGIVHLDLKPANVLLTEDGPRVIDFGIAQIERLTEPRSGFAGTYAYASPEQIREHEQFTPASDVFSLGTLLARLALGRLPWGRKVLAVMTNICDGTPDLAGLPAELEEVVRSCLQTDPARRPTPAAVAAALAAGSAGAPLGPEVERFAPPPLPAEATTIIREHATLPATRHFETLVHTRVARPDDTTVAARPTMGGDTSDTPREDRTPDTAAQDLEAQVLAWEREGGSKPTGQVRRECGAFAAEARSRLGEDHPLALRLKVSHAMLGYDGTDGTDGTAYAERVVDEAAVRLGDGHPTVRDARTLLAALRSAPPG